MVRAKKTAVMWMTVLVIAGIVPRVMAEASWRLYDLRDVLAAVPQKDAPAPPACPSLPAAFGEAAPPAPEPEEPSDWVEDIVGELSARLAMDFVAVRPGVYAIEGEEEEHAQLRQMLTQLRDLYDERYEVDLMVYEVESNRVPSIGDEVAPEAPVRRQSLVAARRTPMKVEVVSRQSYLAGVAPVVATSAAAYAPEVKQAVEGLSLTLMIGASQYSTDSISIDVTGTLRKVEMGKTSDPVAGENSKLRIELPVEHSRSIESHIRVPVNKSCVLAVVDGFDNEHAVVIAARIRGLGEQ